MKKSTICFLFIVFILFSVGMLLNNLQKIENLTNEIDSLQTENKMLKEVVDQYDSKKVVLTAYNSLKNQTDDTPFITASGSRTSVQTLALTQDLVSQYIQDNLPDTGISFGDTVHIIMVKTFIVEDIKHNRYLQGGDIWTENYADAMKFGIQNGYLIYKRKENQNEQN